MVTTIAIWVTLEWPCVNTACLTLINAHLCAGVLNPMLGPFNSYRFEACPTRCCHFNSLDLSESD